MRLDLKKLIAKAQERPVVLHRQIGKIAAADLANIPPSGKRFLHFLAFRRSVRHANHRSIRAQRQHPVHTEGDLRDI